MRMGALLVFVVMLAPLTAVAVQPAAAQSRHGQSGVAPLDRLLPEIRRTHPGEFYDAEGPLRGPDGQLQYRLKWMTPDGRIIWLDTDARTGRVLGPDTGPREPPPRYYAPAPSYSYPRGANSRDDREDGDSRSGRGRTYDTPFSGQGRGGDDGHGRGRPYDRR